MLRGGELHASSEDYKGRISGVVIAWSDDLDADGRYRGRYPRRRTVIPPYQIDFFHPLLIFIGIFLIFIV